MEHRVTYCRICEPMCGLIAAVENDRLVSLRPDPDHPLSQGRACPKGIAFTEEHVSTGSRDEAVAEARRRALIP